jgi:hypothetical protein
VPGRAELGVHQVGAGDGAGRIGCHVAGQAEAG